MSGNRDGWTGWLPADIGFDGRPALVTDAQVRWVELGSTPLAEPFFDDTVDRLGRAVPPARETMTGLETILRAADGLPVARPAGFIFHISRCGSTLIANALRETANTVVVSESRALTRLLLPGAGDSGPYLANRWDEKRRALVEAFFRLFACYRTGNEERLVIKFTSVNILCMSIIRRYWPEVPCVVVVRDPAEVMVANLEGGGWMGFRENPGVAEGMFGFSCVGMADEVYTARVVGRFLECALAAPGEGCTVVDYEDLNERRIRELALLFGIGLPESGKSLENVFQYYSKDPNRRTKFEDDRPRKRRETTPEIREAARRWAMAAYSGLRAR